MANTNDPAAVTKLIAEYTSDENLYTFPEPLDDLPSSVGFKLTLFKLIKIKGTLNPAVVDAFNINVCYNIWYSCRISNNYTREDLLNGQRPQAAPITPELVSRTETNLGILLALGLVVYQHEPQRPWGWHRVYIGLDRREAILNARQDKVTELLLTTQ